MLESPNVNFLGNHLQLLFLAGIPPPAINPEVLIPCFYLKGPFLGSHWAWNTMDNPGADPGGQREFEDKGQKEPRMDELPAGENLELIRIPRLFQSHSRGAAGEIWESPRGKSIKNGEIWDPSVGSGRYLGFFCLFQL